MSDLQVDYRPIGHRLWTIAPILEAICEYAADSVLATIVHLDQRSFNIAAAYLYRTASMLQLSWLQDMVNDPVSWPLQCHEPT
jgi:hypothetical protein